VQHLRTTYGQIMVYKPSDTLLHSPGPGPVTALTCTMKRKYSFGGQALVMRTNNPKLQVRQKLAM